MLAVGASISGFRVGYPRAHNHTISPLPCLGSVSRVSCSTGAHGVSERRSVHDEQPRPLGCMRAMRLGPVGHLIAHARLQCEGAAVLEDGLQLTLDAEEDVAL